jgi:hypothetical protein
MTSLEQWPCQRAKTQKKGRHVLGPLKKDETWQGVVLGGGEGGRLPGIGQPLPDSTGRGARSQGAIGKPAGGAAWRGRRCVVVWRMKNPRFMDWLRKGSETCRK